MKPIKHWGIQKNEKTMTNSDRQIETHLDEWDEEIHSDEVGWEDLIFEISFEEQEERNEWEDLILATFFLKEIHEAIKKQENKKKFLNPLM